MARLLFVTWNDSDYPAQFSVPPDCTLKQITSEPVVLEDASELKDGSRAEFMLDATRVRAAYMVDVPDGVMIGRIEPLEVAADTSWMLPASELEAQAEDEARDRNLAE